MESKKIVHFLHVPWTGLGLYGGFRGNRWLRNRIAIFKQFVVPSIEAQTSKDFVLWCAWRYEERSNEQVKELKKYLDNRGIKNVFTYSGICFWDDKYPDDVAYSRLSLAVHGSMGALLEEIGQAEEVLMTIQPSDDCYHKHMVEETQQFFKDNKDTHVFGYKMGYVMDYTTLRLKDWNPKTTPPFYTIRFPKDTFVEPLKHLQYTGPYKSHEYVKDYLPALYKEYRGFIVGTHGENISTVFDHPYTGNEYMLKDATLNNFGLMDVMPLKIKLSVRKLLLRKLPHWLRRKLRYYLGEKIFSKLYDFLRS